MLIEWSSHEQVVAAEVIVIPRSCSCAISPWWRFRHEPLHAMLYTGIEQDAFGNRSFTGINMRHNPDIAGTL